MQKDEELLCFAASLILQLRFSNDHFLYLVSCFYAESPSYNFQMTGHVWTKSKFLGLSIAVDMVGEATVKLLNHNESYRITFPSAYGRNILAVPWSELGGMCILEGIETGYKAEIEFRTRVSRKTSPRCK